MVLCSDLIVEVSVQELLLVQDRMCNEQVCPFPITDRNVLENWLYYSIGIRI